MWPLRSLHIHAPSSSERDCRLLALVGALSLELASASLAAQPSGVRLPPGVRARVTTAPRAEWITGTVVLADSLRIVLRSAPNVPSDTVPVGAIQALEVSTGRRRVARMFGGIIIGTLVGGAVGAAVDVAADVGASQDAPAGVVGAFLGGIAGALVGGVVGAATAPERWRRVPVP